MTIGTPASLARRGRFTGAVAAARERGELLVQPRMGFPGTDQMAAGLRAVQAAEACTVGTITLDSYTRVGDHESARAALRTGAELNGFPIVAHGAPATREMIDPFVTGNFPIQVRHGSPSPLGIFKTLAEAGLDATEGGPVSYCLPYSRTPLAEAVHAWERCCELFATSVPGAHLETFGGCLLGQLCPPALLIAVSILEGLFFRQHGLRSVSLSYAQQTSHAQDLAAIAALRRLAAERLGDIDWHVVLYTYMGVFPRTEPGALALLRRSARLAVSAGVERLIVKTPAEAHRIPTIADNVRALQEAATAARYGPLDPDEPLRPVEGETEELYQEARTLIDAVLEIGSDVGSALLEAFRRGYLDVPYCLHSDNAQRARGFIDGTGRLRWQSVGRMPIRAANGGSGRLGADELLTMLSYVQETFDRPVVEAASRRPPLAPPAGIA